MSYIRILHAVPNAPAVDVYANDTMIARNLPYNKFTEYLQVPPGPYNIRIYPSGEKNDDVLDADLTIPSNTITTIAAIGLLPEIDLFPILDPEQDIEPGKVCIRFTHLSPNAPPVDITLPDGTILFDDVMYEEVTDYLCINPGRFTLQARVAGTDQVVLNVPNIRLKPNRFYTVYAVGLVGDRPPLQVLIPLDGNSYIQF
ncbi:MAG: hypothetical protein CVV02_05805 [Firmicutes bacterium HGW-Firmicutes-7]|nr:MAG: hypothetical protein CVV02_05805 [Firmicutes bacterium HGW-Firmicutes-7]